MKDFFLIGEIKAVFDKDGFVSIESFSDFDDRFIELKFVYTKIYGVVKKLYIEDVNTSSGNILIQFRNFNSAESVQALVGLKLYVDELNAVQLDKGTNFIHDLIGSSIIYENSVVGTLKDVYVLETNDVYVIQKSDGREILLPGVDDYIDSIDVAKRQIRLKRKMESIF